ncbi:MAG TPA: 50S ribosomal protein L11 methyltransferase [Vicinamibacterales bacterium]
MPYRIDVRASPGALDALIDFGALDVEGADGALTALMPDHVTAAAIARALGLRDLSVTPAIGRDNDSVWTLKPRPVQIGRIRIVPADTHLEPGAVRLLDTSAFGTGLHPTTALCLEALDEDAGAEPPASLLDVGTGSGILTLAALRLGVPQVVAVDIDAEAVRVARRNAALNGVAARVTLLCGGPEAVAGMFPFVIANVLAAPLIEMAPTLVRRVGRGGRLVLSGIPESTRDEVAHAYQHLGMRRIRDMARAGWTAIVLAASW